MNAVRIIEATDRGAGVAERRGLLGSFSSGLKVFLLTKFFAYSQSAFTQFLINLVYRVNTVCGSREHLRLPSVSR